MVRRNTIQRCPLCGVTLDENGVCPKSNLLNKNLLALGRVQRRFLLFYPLIEGRFPKLLFSVPSGSDFKYSESLRWAIPTP